VANESDRTGTVELSYYNEISFMGFTARAYIGSGNIGGTQYNAGGSEMVDLSDVSIILNQNDDTEDDSIDLNGTINSSDDTIDGDYYSWGVYEIGQSKEFGDGEFTATK
jgi:hypothetical protein